MPLKFVLPGALLVLLGLGAGALLSQGAFKPSPPVNSDVERVQVESKDPQLLTTDTAIKTSSEIKASTETKETEDSIQQTAVETKVLDAVVGGYAILKDVGEPAYDHFGLVDADFAAIKTAGFDVIEGTFDICADEADVKFFLDNASKHDLKVILNAGAGEAEWGYSCDDNFVPGQKPVWQAAAVKAWVATWKDHPALLAWDTSNEDGGTTPFGTGGINPDPDWETKYALTPDQLRQAYVDVKSVDAKHPILIRMNGWYFYDNDSNFFRPGNYFGKDVADIVMVNAYSNVDEYFDDFVSTVMLRATRSIHAIDSDVMFVPSLGVWTEPPIWFKPTVSHLVNDFNQAAKTEDLYGVAYFKYGAREGDDWYLPDPKRGDASLWKEITTLNTHL